MISLTPIQAILERADFPLSRWERAGCAEIVEESEFDVSGDIVLCMSQLNLSARTYHRILKLSRTIADLAGSDEI